MEEAAGDRKELWLGLLRRLTADFPDWSAWKNVSSAFAGTGDIDSFAPPEDWTGIQETFESWVAEQGLGPVIVCRHIPQGPHFITLQDSSPYIVQLDVKVRGTFRGSTLIDAWDLQELCEMDPLGFRRVRPGVEGVIKLCLNGTRRGGRPNQEGLESKQVAALLAQDPDGVEAGSELLGPASAALRRGAAAVVDGGWDHTAMRRVEAWSFFRCLAEPGVAASRIWFTKWVAPRCPVVSLIRQHDRRVPADRDRWLAEVAREHEVRQVV